MGLVNRFRAAIKDPRRALWYHIVRLRNIIADAFSRKVSRKPTGFREFDEIVERSGPRTDISDHLPLLFVEAMDVHPDLIVELGVRTGESTFVFERVAALHDATLVSADINDCSRACP